jgi:hypothetical protein
MIRRDRNSPSLICYELSLDAQSHPDNEAEFNR